MATTFSLSDIYDKNINLLIGSGASYGLFPTLALKVKGVNSQPVTVETFATSIENGRADLQYTALFMHYYAHCIEPVLTMNYTEAAAIAGQKEVLENYSGFLKTILNVLGRKKSGDKKVCNIFTTNYDGCLTFAAEELVKSGAHEFHMNDGTSGFKRRFLDARNFSKLQTQTGVFGKYRNDVPQVNLIQIHGSTYWFKDEQRIQIDYFRKNDERLVDRSAFHKCAAFFAGLMDENVLISDLPALTLTVEEVATFWNQYDTLPIVNPTKWKFHETVFEEHYYQMLRYLSYELEKPNSTLLAFGFSFADEHIRNLIKRSLSNPSLQVFVCCFDEASQAYIESEFGHFSNVQAITIEGALDFTAFNNQIFRLAPSPTPAPAVVAQGEQA